MSQTRMALWFVSSVFLFSLGCASSVRVKLVAEPDEATARIEASHDQRYDKTASVSSSAVYDLRFPDKEDSAYEVTFEAEGHESETVVLTKQTVSELPRDAVDDGLRILHVELKEKEYVVVPEFVIVFDPRAREYLGIRKWERAYPEDTEVTTAPPRRVYSLGTDLRISGLDLSPSGSELIFSIAELANPDAENSPVTCAHLRSVSTEGGGIRYITDDRHVNLSPVYNHDGEQIFFVSNRFSESYSIVRKGCQRGGVAPIYSDPQHGRCEHPSMSRRGELVFDTVPIDNLSSGARLWMVAPDDYPVQLGLGRQANVSPDGTEIAYIGPDHNVWVASADGTDRVQLTSKAREILSGLSEINDVAAALLPEVYPPYSFPTWSPDGEHIVYTSREGRDNTGAYNQDIWVMNANGTGEMQLTTTGSADLRPLVSDDGKWVYFVSNRGGTWAIWRMEASFGISG